MSQITILKKRWSQNESSNFCIHSHQGLPIQRKKLIQFNLYSNHCLFQIFAHTCSSDSRCSDTNINAITKNKYLVSYQIKRLIIVFNEHTYKLWFCVMSTMIRRNIISEKWYLGSKECGYVGQCNHGIYMF